MDTPSVVTTTVYKNCIEKSTKIERTEENKINGSWQYPGQKKGEERGQEFVSFEDFRCQTEDS